MTQQATITNDGREWVLEFSGTPADAEVRRVLGYLPYIPTGIAVTVPRSVAVATIQAMNPDLIIIGAALE